MSKTYRLVLATVVVAVLALIARGVYRSLGRRPTGMLSEKITHRGNVWTVDFSARIPAPRADVFAVIQDIEHSHSDQVRNVRVITSEANRKVVEMELAGPAGQTLKSRVLFRYFPDQFRIQYRTLKSSALNTDAEYRLAEDGSNTILNLHQETTVANQGPLPDSLVKQVIRRIFIAQFEGLERALNVSPEEDDGDDGLGEP